MRKGTPESREVSLRFTHFIDCMRCMNFYEYVCRMDKSQVTLMMLMERMLSAVTEGGCQTKKKPKKYTYHTSCLAMPLLYSPHVDINTHILFAEYFIIHDGHA